MKRRTNGEGVSPLTPTTGCLVMFRGVFHPRRAFPCVIPSRRPLVPLLSALLLFPSCLLPLPFPRLRLPPLNSLGQSQSNHGPVHFVSHNESQFLLVSNDLGMAASCFPPLPVTTTTTNTAQTTTTVRTHRQPITTSTYRSFRDVDDDEDGIAVLESIEIETVPPTLSWRERLRRSLRRRRRGKGIETQTSTSLANTTITMTTTFSEPRPLLTLARSQSDGHLPQVGGMSRPAKPAAQAKKVAPPAVPELYRLSGSSFGSSAGYGSSGEDTSSPNIVLGPDGTPCVPNTTATIHRDLIDSAGDPYGAGKSPSGQFSYPAFTFPGPQGGQYAKASLYHHQLSLQEDQGIDMTQSPGRDSPGSSGSGSGSRHSTASLDSGRASGFHPMAPRGSTLSSSSLGSGGEHGSGGPPSVASGPRAERLLNQGVPDQDVIHAWLMDLHFEEYFPLFASAGYDLPTICRMTPEDLTAIGIKKPNHRKKLKAEIAQLNIPDGLPDYIPGSLDEWLRLLRLEEYGPALVSQGYLTVEDVTQLTWEDLEDIGIVKLGHQKKILLAIKRVNDVRAGKRVQPPQEPQPPSPTTILDTTSASCVYQHHHHLQQHSYYMSGGGPPLGGGWTTLDWRRQSTAHPAHPSAAAHLSQSLYGHDIVPIKIRGARGKSLESLEDPTERGLHPGALGGVIPASHLTFQVPAMAPLHHPHHGLMYYPTWRPRSYDDGDLTPTNDLQNTTHVMFEGGGTLPRPRGLVRPRPIAKIPAKQRSDLLDVHNKFCSEKPADCQTTTITVDLHSTSSSPLSLPAYPSGDELSPSEDLPLPPPPAPATPPPTSSQPPARQGSDASFKSTSSTESDSMPFANENAGTIKQRATRPHPALPGVATSATTSTTSSPGPHAASTSSPDFSPPKRAGPSDLAASQKILRDRPPAQEPADVLNDIGNMLANLTDELDAMLEEEKRQGLSH